MRFSVSTASSRICTDAAVGAFTKANPDIKVEVTGYTGDQAGFTKGSDGIRTANGHKMVYTVITPTDLTGVDRSFQIIQADFRQIGVVISQRNMDDDATFTAITAPDNKYLTFEVTDLKYKEKIR